MWVAGHRARAQSTDHGPLTRDKEWSIPQLTEDGFGFDSESQFDLCLAEFFGGVFGEDGRPADVGGAVVGLGEQQAGGVEPLEGELGDLLQAGAVVGALAVSFGEEGLHGEAQGGGAGEVAELLAQHAGGDGRNTGELVHGSADVGKVGVFAGGGGVSAELLDLGIGVVGQPEPARADGELVEVVDALAEVHAEALECQTMGAVAEAGVEFVLKGHERLDIRLAGVAHGDGLVLDVDEGEVAEAVGALSHEPVVFVALPLVCGEDIDHGGGGGVVGSDAGAGCDPALPPRVLDGGGGVAGSGGMQVGDDDVLEDLTEIRGVEDGDAAEGVDDFEDDAAGELAEAVLGEGVEGRCGGRVRTVAGEGSVGGGIAHADGGDGAGIELDQNIDMAEDAADERELLEEGLAAEAGEDESEQAGEDGGQLWLRRGAEDLDFVAEEVVELGLDAPADVVFDDDFFAGGAGGDGCRGGGGEECAAGGADAGDAGGQAPLLCLAVRRGGGVVGGGGVERGNGVGVVGVHALKAGVVLLAVLGDGELEWCG